MSDYLAPDFREDPISQVPAIRLLDSLGWNYLTPDEALAMRGNKLSNVILDGILLPWLRENNSVRYKGKVLPFTEGNILSAYQSLKEIPFDGLVRTNEKIYDLLCLGKSLQQSVDGDIKSFSLKYIDWKSPENNVYHVTEEFSVERTGSHKTRRPDIILFVNGIPLGIIECKSPHLKEPIGQAISQHLRNQKEGQIPELFIYSQMLLALSKNEAKYATTGTPAKFWAIWREEDESAQEELQDLVNIPLTEDQIDKLFSSNFIIRENPESYGLLTRQVTEQDKAIYGLCRPQRFIELIFRFIIFDAGDKKIARYQQYFCVDQLLKRIGKLGSDGKRRGGVVWHTQGSGKSLTMVMLAKAIALGTQPKTLSAASSPSAQSRTLMYAPSSQASSALHSEHWAAPSSSDINDYKIVLVTDRVDLDDQIYKTFQQCGKDVEQAKTGKDLSEMLTGKKQRIITTVIDKFEAAVGKYAVRNEDPNIFVLVDEAHRSQYKSRNAKMRRVLPNACYIGFTGTPIMKRDRNTVEKFGGFIKPFYTIARAVEDHSVVPLLYEGRHVGQEVDDVGIDAWFDRITENLSKEQAADLKKKFSTTDQLNKTAQKVMAIAWDISEHYRDNWQGTGFKGQLVAPGKPTALLYKKYLDEFGIVSSEVLISGPDDREGEEDLYTENKLPVQRFWEAMMKKFGNEKQYNKQIINSFKNADEPEIIIVVDKLLTGFDAPRNAILYLTRKLKDHTLLQAIARVNRIHENKDFGYILDYRGVLENLDKALDLYSTLPEFDPADLANTLTDVSVEISKLPEKHSILWSTFNALKNQSDEEEFELLLADDELRSKFYDRLSAYARVFSIALASEKFFDDTSQQKINRYKKDLKFFSKLKASVQRRYAETVDFSEYEPRIQKLLDTHVRSGEVEQITDLVNIFDKEAFSKEVDKLASPAAKADTIAHRTARTINERMQEDPAFYKRFSEMLKETILAFREERLRDIEYLNKVKEIMNAVINRTGDKIPAKLQGADVAKAYYGAIKEVLARFVLADPSLDDVIADIAIEVDQIIDKNRVVSWVNDLDVQNQMKNQIEDGLFEFKDRAGINVSLDDIDSILDQCLSIAKVRKP